MSTFFVLMRDGYPMYGSDERQDLQDLIDSEPNFFSKIDTDIVLVHKPTIKHVLEQPALKATYESC